MFSRQKPVKPIIKYVQVPAKGSEKTANGSGQLNKKLDDTGRPAQKATDLNAGKPVARGVRASGHGGSAEGKPSKEKGGGLTGLGGLASLKGRGPRVGPSTALGQAVHRQPLDSTAVQRTVSRYTGSVRRSCWQPALNTRGKNAPSSARVSVTIHVSATGRVRGVSTSGDPRGYHGLASCIGSRVRGWQFPASDGVTTVNVPFVFAAQ